MQCTYNGLVAGELGPHVGRERDEGTLIAHCITAYRVRRGGGEQQTKNDLVISK